jgi:hypothetical protein
MTKPRPTSTPEVPVIPACPIIYIAGPMRAPDAWQWEQNMRRAEEWSFWLMARGAAPICPHTMGRHFDRALPDHVFLGLDFAYIDRSDALLLIEGWPNSKGSCAERDYATAIDLPVFEYERRTALMEWIRDWKVRNARAAHVISLVARRGTDETSHRQATDHRENRDHPAQPPADRRDDQASADGDGRAE